MRSHISIYLLPILFCTYSCITAQPAGVAHTDEQIPFDLEQPKHKIELPYILREISGLDYHEERLLAVQDEVGIIFIIHSKTGAIEKQLKLFGPGDSEGVASNGKTFFLNTSDGLIFTLNANANTTEMAKILRTALPEGGDYEALEWDEDTQQLLIATKDNLKGADFPGKNRYIFSVQTEPPFGQEVVLTIDYPLIKKYLKVDEEGVIRYADLDVEYDKPKPSALGIDPLTGLIYVLNDSGKMLLVYKREGDLHAVALLNKEIFEKPEGIAFDTQGNLYISNEQKSQAANILFFPRKKISGG